MNRGTHRPYRRALRSAAAVLVTAVAAVVAPARADDPLATPAGAAAVPGQVGPLRADSAVLAYQPDKSLRPGDARAAVVAHAVTLTAPSTLLQALSASDAALRRTAWFRQSPDVRDRAAWLAARVRAAVVPETYLIELWIDARPGELSAADRQTILQELGAAYAEDARKRRTQELMDRTSMLNGIRIKAEARFADVNREIKQKQVQLALDGGDATGTGQGAREAELRLFVGKLVDAQLEFAAAHAALDRLKTAAENAPREGAPGGGDAPEVLAAVRADDRVRKLRDHLDDAEIRLAAARARPAPAPAAPADPLAGPAKPADGPAKPAAAGAKAAPPLAELEAQVEALSRKLDQASAEVATQARVALLDRAQARATAAANLVENLGKRVNNLRQDVGELAIHSTSLELLRGERDRLAREIATAREEITQIMAATTLPVGDIRWHIAPEAPHP